MTTTIYVSEYTQLGYVGNSPTQLIQAPAGPPLVEQHIQVGSNSVASAPFSSKTKFIRVVTDTTANLAFGTAPVAVTNAHLLPANAVVFYAVAPGSSIAVIANS